MEMKKVGILGSGSVGQALGKGFADAGYHVKVGTRDPSKLQAWAVQTGKNASVGSFKDAASFGEIVVIATKWTGTQEAISQAGKEHFKGKIVIDVTNPLLFEEGKTPTMAVGFPSSGGELIQKWLPDAKIVKCFNIVTAAYMTNAKLLEGTPDLFISGNSVDAKKIVTHIAEKWGWHVIDIGEIDQSYLLEALAMLWIRYGFLHNHWTHAWKLLKK